jgi:hypothetical protein
MPRSLVWLGAAALLTFGVTVGLVAGLSVRDHETTVSTVTRTASDLIPPRAELVDLTALGGTVPAQVAVVWRKPGAPYGSGLRLAVWERRRGAWQRIYLRNLPDDNEWKIEDVRLIPGDLTGDGRDDLSVYDDHDGSAGGFTFRLFRSLPRRMEQIDSLSGTRDRNAVFMRGTDLVTYTGVGKDPASGSNIHCCPSYWRRDLERWNGKRLVIVSRTRLRSVPAPALAEVR